MNKIYFKLVKYFILLIITTSLASTVLFFMTVGLPVFMDIHRLIHKQVIYVSHLTEDLVEQNASIEALNDFLHLTAKTYEAQLALFDHNLNIVAQTDVDIKNAFRFTDKMLSDIRKKGFFVQPNHMGKPLIYIVPVAPTEEKTHFLFLYKEYSIIKQVIIFSIGLIILCLLFIIGIYPLARSFTRPITQLTAAVHDIAAGKFNPDIKMDNRKDELGELFQVFTEMSQSVNKMVETKKVLLADISHELRSPLGRMSIAIELLRDTCRSSDADGYIGNMEYEVNYMNNLLKQLSDYSILNLPDFKLNPEFFSACDMIKEVQKHYQPIMNKKGFTFSLVPCDRSLTIEADRAKTTQVINNLLDNAINACIPGGIITIGYTESAGKITFAISNTGPEIPIHLREKIFTPLFRTDPSRSRKTGGLGLGLAISKKVIECHGGNISCNCKDGVTSFQFTLNTKL